jgi:hypothetical protein
MSKSTLENSLTKAVLEALGQSKPARAKPRDVSFHIDPNMEQALNKTEESPTLMKSVLNAMNKDELVRLAFETDPSQISQYQSLYKSKMRLIPDKLLKRLAIQDDLVASISQARQAQMSAFGRPRPDRFSTGFIIEMRQETNERIEKLPEQEKQAKKEEIQKRISEITKRIMTCGDADILGEDDQLTFPQYISMSIRNAIILGRLATEVIWGDGNDGKKNFACFRVIDAGTIYRAAPQRAAAEQVRRQARLLLEQIKNKKLVPERYQNDEYSWVQVIDDRPVQAFTSKECIVHNFYEVPDVELDGYPVTPIDTIISAVTTHINITTHNKLYFQNGRAARGMLVIKSDDADEKVIQRIRQQFNASINSVQNAWRMPVFGVGGEDEIEWMPIDQGGRDMEFQYLMDMNARVIFSAFQMAPEEIPGWAYLSRGTNNQALSEGNNEYKLEAARDVGIRPLLAKFEDFLNASILPLFDEEVAKLCVIKLVGLDAETAEKESVRLQQDMPVHMTYDEVLQKVEKDPIGRDFGGEFPLNPQIQAVMDKYLTVGEILEKFFGKKGAAQNPQFQYFRDPFFFQWLQLQQQMQQMQMQQQQAAQQQQAGAAGAGGDGGGDGGGGAPPAGGDDSGGGQEASGGDVQTENQKTDAVQEASASPAEDLSRSIDQAIGLLSKSESQLPPSKRKTYAMHKKLLDSAMKGWAEDVKEATKDILDIADKYKGN